MSHHLSQRRKIFSTLMQRKKARCQDPRASDSWYQCTLNAHDPTKFYLATQMVPPIVYNF